MIHDPVRWSRRAINMSLVGAMAWPHTCLASPSARTPLQQILLSLFENPGHASAIGRICLDSLPNDVRALDTLEAAILAAAGDTHRTPAAAYAVRREMTYRISDDFANGAVVAVDGWQLSVTEVQLYALVALNLPAAA